MKAFCCLICSLCLFSCSSAGPVKVTGNTNYSQSQQKKLNTELQFEQQFKIYEPPNKNWTTYLGSKIMVDADHFGNELKTNVFTTFGIDF